MTETPHLDRLRPIGMRPPAACVAGWSSHLMAGAPGHVFIVSYKSLCVQSSVVELALILFYDGLAYRPGLN